MTTAWVVGASGMLGQAVCRALADRGVEAVGLAGRCDVTDAAAVLACARGLAAAACGPPRAVFNCAAMTQVDDCEGRAEEAMAVNGAGAGHVARAALAIGAPLVHVSTDYVFGGDAVRPLSELSECRPASVYGQSKRRGEELVAEAFARAPGGWAATVRTSWLFGDQGQHFVATMLRLMGEREELQVVDDQWGRPTYAADLAACMVALTGIAGGRRASPGIYHYANHGPVTWHGFAAEIWRHGRSLGLPLRLAALRPVSSSQYPQRAPRPAYSVLATAKIEATLGQAPRRWQDALEAHLGARGLAAG